MSTAIRIPSVLLLSVLLLLSSSSCSHRYQVYVLQSNQVQSKEGDFSYEDSTFTISYDFWADGGRVLFNVFNRSQDSVYFLMDSSIWIRGNDSLEYYSPENHHELDHPDSSNTLSYSPWLYFSPMVVVPPGEDRWLEGFSVSFTWVKFNDSDRDRISHYSENESPVMIKNILAYSERKNSKIKRLEHDFWVSLVKKTSDNNFQLMADRNLPRSDKFYVSRKLAKGGRIHWLDIGLSVLENLAVFL